LVLIELVVLVVCVFLWFLFLIKCGLDWYPILNAFLFLYRSQIFFIHTDFIYFQKFSWRCILGCYVFTLLWTSGINQSVQWLGCGLFTCGSGPSRPGFSLYHNFETGFGAQPASYPVGTGVFSSDSKVAGDMKVIIHLHAASAEVKNVWSYTFMLLCVFMASCLIKLLAWNHFSLSCFLILLILRTLHWAVVYHTKFCYILILFSDDISQ
jgi:hypothetical protein